MNALFRTLLITGIVFAGTTASVFAQWNNEEANTPILIQTDFGPYGTQLPGDGGNYCDPTSVTMNLFWAASNGFTQLAPTPTAASELNLDKIMAGLMQTTITGGTTGVGAQTGVATYFAAMGISTSQYSFSQYDPATNSTPILNWLSNNMAANQVVNPQTLTFQTFAINRYNDHGSTTSGTWTQITGHVVDPVSVDLLNQTVTVDNPQPSAFENVLNVPSSDPQTVQVAPLPSGITFVNKTGSMPGGSQDYSQIVSPYRASLNQTVVIKGAEAWSINISALPSSSGYTINPWEIDSSQYINTNGGTFTVIAPLQGSGGFAKAGDGSMILTNTNSLSGSNTISGGSLVSTATSGTPFGTGSVILENNATLQVQPDDTTPANVSLLVASGAGSQFAVDNGGGILQLTKGNNTSLTVTLGGNTDGSTNNLARTNFGTLVIAPDAGLGSLGGSITVFVAGTGSNQPKMTDGMVLPYIMGQDTDSSGAFLAYSSTNGFVKAATVLSTDMGINDASITGTTIYDVNNAQSIASGTTVAVHALEIDGATLGETQPGSTIAVGFQGANDLSGVILNGGTIATSNLRFGSAEGLIYTSSDNGEIDAQIESSSGLTTFGPGNLTITSNNSPTLIGTVSINSGTLIAANSAGSATGSGAVMVNSNATLQVNSGATVSGSVSVGANATLSLNGGTVSGSVNVAVAGSDTAEPGGVLQGSGTLSGTAIIGGNIKAGPASAGTIEFQSAAQINGAAFFWQPNALVDNSTVGSGPGIGWNSLKFDISDLTQLGNSSALTIYLNFSLLGNNGPDSTDSFWQTNHSWTLFDFTNGTPDWNSYDIKLAGTDLPYGSFTGIGSGSTYTLEYIAAPEPTTWALLGCGLGLVALLHLRRNRNGDASLLT